jgi:prolyl-tRNA synthetase
MYLVDKGEQQHVWTTSWGTSTRMVGGLIMAHGDDSGLRVPPSLAPYQIVVLVVRDDSDTVNAAEALTADLRKRGVRVELDRKVSASFGRRVTDWEIKGVPLRVEVGPRDLANGVVTVVRRDNGDKSTVALGEFAGRADALLEDVQSSIFAQALSRREARTVDATSVGEALEAAATGFARISWDDVGEAGEAELNRQAVSVRCLQRADGTVPTSQDEPGLTAIVARSY